MENLIIWENLEVMRYVLRNSSTGEETILHLNTEQEKNDSYFHDPETGVELEVAEKESFVEWMAENYKQYGCNLEFITDRSGEGTQFCKGFGGIGGTLRWKVDFSVMQNLEDAAKLDGQDDDDDSEEESDGGDDDDYGFDDGDFGF